MPKHLISPWINDFDGLISQASKSLLICSPFVGRSPCERIAVILRGRGTANIPILLLTDLSRDNMLSGVTDVGALAGLCDALPRTRIRFLPNLHAKVYIADERYAVVTSANLTDAGLSRNLEYGVYIDERELVKQVTAVSPFMDSNRIASNARKAGRGSGLFLPDEDQAFGIERRWGIKEWDDEEIVVVCSKIWLKVATLFDEILGRFGGKPVRVGLDCLHGHGSYRLEIIEFGDDPKVRRRKQRYLKGKMDEMAKAKQESVGNTERSK